MSDNHLEHQEQSQIFMGYKCLENDPPTSNGSFASQFFVATLLVFLLSLWSLYKLFSHYLPNLVILIVVSR